MMGDEGTPSVESDPIDDAIASAELQIAAIEEWRPFSSKGFEALETSIAEYIRSLALESSRTARRQGGDVVSAADVDQAARYLFRGPPRGVVQHFGTVGGVFLGGAISSVLAFIADGSAGSIAVTVTLLVAVIGAFLIALHIARDAQ
jgi:histone H3/H4